VRDTVLVMPRGARVRIAFDANNPGRWPFHCHNLYHMQTGMMTEVRYDGMPRETFNRGRCPQWRTLT
jgi:FtsP/CotA-like multicopper oxidase with cupredoxin domain